MFVEKFKADKEGRLSKLLVDRYSKLSYNYIQKLFRDKDIKINGKRVSADCEIFIGDEILFFVKDVDSIKSYKFIYEDENIIVLNKFHGIEVISESGEFDLVQQIKRDKNIDIFPVHRLDRNTKGLVIFAKNIDAKKELDEGFKNRTFEKYYLAEVYGEVDKREGGLVAYLKKNASNALVEISDVPKQGYDKIQTNYKIIKTKPDSSVLEVELITGKTHQIRAHLAHIGHFIIGDDKYGNCKINQKMHKKYQNLIANRLKLHFSKNSKLFYLNDKVFEIDLNEIDFLK